ncbi:hypothetical protein [Chondrinema litorale]|uniref:hypothetical protein n=1 Tax=Chondrinema litorale TaxID=2994555 RepID=UPI002542B8BB|nr:hypothetical protein [Chondrinema litorale]UZR98065.1 hypothetical protein OQ292_30025 [Chondrinema litorale]
MATRYFENKVPSNYHGWSTIITAFGIAAYTSDNKCLDYHHTQLNYQKYAQIQFNKPPEKLSVEENIKLLFVLNLPLLPLNKGVSIK